MKNLLNKQIYYLANHFADSKLTKNRIQMMTNPKTKPYKKLYFLWAIPICSLIIFFNVSYIYAKPSVQEELFVVKKNKKYGLINTEKDLIVPYIYDDIKAGTKSDLIAVKLKDKWGFINREGREVIMPQYANVINYSFVNNIAIVSKNNKYAFIDKTGKLLTSFKYDWIEEFNKEGLAVAQFNSRFGIINDKDEIIIPFDYIFMDLPNLKSWCLAQNEDQQWGFVNMQNQVMIPFKYDGLDKIDTKGWIKTAKALGENYVYGFINTKENITIPFEYEYLTNFQKDGLAYAQKNGKWGVINRKNEIVIPFEYMPPNHDNYNENFLKNIQNNRIVMQKNGKYGLLDYNNKLIIPFEYDRLTFTQYNTMLKAQNKDFQMACIDMNGKVIIPFRYNMIRVAENYIIAQNPVKGIDYVDVQQELYDLKGNLLIPFSAGYRMISPIRKDLFIVHKGRKYGIVNKQGKIMMPLEERLIKGLKSI